MYMQINSNETVTDLISRLEREAQERMTLVASLKRVLKAGGVVSESAPESAKRTPNRKKGSPTLADRIESVMQDVGEPMTQPEIRKELQKRDLVAHLKNPASAISTAMSRREGKTFQRGENYEWQLISEVHDVDRFNE